MPNLLDRDHNDLREGFYYFLFHEIVYVSKDQSAKEGFVWSPWFNDKTTEVDFNTAINFRPVPDIRAEEESLRKKAQLKIGQVEFIIRKLEMLSRKQH